MQTTRLLMLMAVAVLFAGTVPVPVHAQGGTGLDNINSAILRNAELLQRAAELIDETASVKARISLDAARSLHARSIKMRDGGMRPALVGSAVAEARRAIMSAISIGKQEAKLEENARNATERAARNLEQARSALDDYGDRDELSPRRLIEEAHKQLQMARNHMSEHMFATALQLANASTDLSRRAIAMLNRDNVKTYNVVRALERTDQALSRALESNIAETHPNALRVLREATELQERAKGNARKSRNRIAVEQTRRARDMVLQLARSVGSGANAGRESAENAIMLTDEFLVQAGAIAREQNAENAMRKLGEAREVQQNAKAAYERNQYTAAYKKTHRARDMARKAIRDIEKPIAAAQVGQALDRTDQVIAQLGDKLTGQERGAAAELLQRAVARQREARSAAETGDLRRALAMTRVARNLALRGIRLLGNDGS